MVADVARAQASSNSDSRASSITSEQLQRLLSPPDSAVSERHAQQTVINALAGPLSPARIANVLEPLLVAEQARASQLQAQLTLSTQQTKALLHETRSHFQSLLQRTIDLKSSHESLEDALIDHTEVLVSSASQRDQATDSTTGPGTPNGTSNDGTTLREKLEAFNQRRKELEVTKQWFAVLVKAEDLGLRALRALEQGSLVQAQELYIELVNYVKERHAAAPQLTLTSHLATMATSVWNGMIKILSSRVLAALEAMGWPKPLKERATNDAKFQTFQAAFSDMLVLQKVQMSHPLPAASLLAGKDGDSPTPAKPLIAFQPLVHPLLLRFKWHFEGDKNTNRIDKPEYPLSHVLNLLTAHERFLNEEVQELLDENGFSEVKAVNEFTTLLLPPLTIRVKHHMPQLLDMPPILAHTIFQLLEFDEVLRRRGYRPRGLKGDWKGLSDIVLGRKDWYSRWLEGEREFFDKRYYAAISAQDAWQIVSEDDYDPDDGRSGTRPTNSALKVAELAQSLADRYRPLPTVHGLPFLFKLHLPLLASYAERVTSSLDAFESLAFGMLPGALATQTAATAGVGGLLRVVRAGVSARWMSEKCSEWGEDAFFLGLYDYLTSMGAPDDLQTAAKELLSSSEGTLFDRERVVFEQLADRSEDLIVRHCVREVLGDLKPYLGRRWDYPKPEGEDVDVDSLTSELNAPLALFTALLKTLVESYPHAVATTLYRRIAVNLSTSLYDRLLVNRTWSEAGAHQLNYDIDHGFLQAGREAGIRRGVARGWDKLVGGAKIMALPATSFSDDGGETENDAEDADSRHRPAHELTFSKVMQLAFDDSVPEGEGTQFNVAMEQLGVGEVLGKVEVQQVMRRRPECWR
ncbi:hypothetical protein ACM66B_002633 [Microbotryomycetes sp. NB124-2]